MKTLLHNNNNHILIVKRVARKFSQFCFIFICLFIAIGLVKHPALYSLIDSYCLVLAKITYFVVNLFSDSFSIGRTLILHNETLQGVTVDKSCSGLDIATAAACFAFFINTQWRYKIAMALAASAIIQAANLVRIILLLLSEVYVNHLFDFIHVKLFPFLLILLVIIVLMALNKHSDKPQVSVSEP